MDVEPMAPAKENGTSPTHGLSQNNINVREVLEVLHTRTAWREGGD